MQGGAENFLQQMSQLPVAATNAASAAEHALTAMQAASSSSSAGGVAGALQSGLTAASKVLRNPDPFDGSDPHGFTTWKFVFMSWLTFAEPKYQKLLEHVEQLDHMPSMSEYSDEEQQFSSRLFAILTHYLKGQGALFTPGEIRFGAKRRIPSPERATQRISPDYKS